MAKGSFVEGRPWRGRQTAQPFHLVIILPASSGVQPNFFASSRSSPNVNVLGEAIFCDSVEYFTPIAFPVSALVHRFIAMDPAMSFLVSSSRTKFPSLLIFGIVFSSFLRVVYNFYCLPINLWSRLVFF